MALILLILEKNIKGRHTAFLKKQAGFMTYVYYYIIFNRIVLAIAIALNTKKAFCPIHHRHRSVQGDYFMEDSNTLGRNIDVKT